MTGPAAPLPLDWTQFLAEHWQRKPLLVRNAFENWQPPLDANELAGLALEASIESRIIEQRDGQWHLTHGPFDTGDFDRQHPWTLLVQGVDTHVPEVAALRRAFHPLPDWRLDDVMVSYASDGGSVGPHYDHYDVFLLQGHGHRRWQIGQRCDESTPLEGNSELRILADFKAVQTFDLGPGDMLYLPPGIAHWGIAQGECTTFSIGFRAPRIETLLSRRVDAQLESLPPDRFFVDPGRTACGLPGEISADDRARVRTQLQALWESYEDDRWFGELVTEVPDDDAWDDDPAPAPTIDAHTRYIALAPTARLAWQAGPGSTVTVFANGHSQAFPDTVRETLCSLCAGDVLAGAALAAAHAHEATGELLHWLASNEVLDVE